LKVIDENGWYKTGDVGYFDDTGALHVHGRVVDMIQLEGKKVIAAYFSRFIFNTFYCLDSSFSN
jgi:long-subunit acyl-CoA synthetase (AMP-forming)